MKITTTFFFIISMVLMVSCGGDSKKSSSSSNSLNAYGYKVQTFNAYYTPTKQYMVYYGSQWYSLQPMSNGQDIQSLQQTTANAIMSGSSQYPLQVIQIGGAYVTVFRVRIQGMLGSGYTGTTGVQQPVQQGQTASSGVIGVQSIQLY